MDLLLQRLLKRYNDTLEKVIIEVLTNLLKRPPTIEDYKKISWFANEGVHDKFYLAYENKKLGTVIIKKTDSFANDYTIKIEFVPFEMDEFLEPATNKKGTKVTFKNI